MRPQNIMKFVHGGHFEFQQNLKKLIDCKMCIFSDNLFEFFRPQKNWGWYVAAILNFIKNLKKTPAHLHIMGNAIVKFE